MKAHEQLRAWRKARGIGLAPVAILFDCSVSFVSNMERGISPIPMDRVPALAELLGVPLVDLAKCALRTSAAYREYRTVVDSQKRVVDSLDPPHIPLT